MNSSSLPLSTPALNMEKIKNQSLDFYTGKSIKKEHTKAHIVKSGCHVSNQYPYMGAPTDGVVQRKCCGNGLFEIKCT